MNFINAVIFGVSMPIEWILLILFGIEIIGLFVLIYLRLVLRSRRRKKQNSLQENTVDQNIQLGENGIVINRGKVLSFEEKYNNLSKEQKKYFDKLVEYAMTKTNATKKQGVDFLQIKAYTKPLVKLKIKRDVINALFKIEDESLKDYLKSQKGKQGKIIIKDIAIEIENEDSFEKARGLVDLAFSKIEQQKSRKRSKKSETPAQKEEQEVENSQKQAK